MSNQDINIKIKVDGSDVTKNIKAVDKSVEDLDKSLKDLDKASGSAFVGMTDDIEGAGDAYDELGEKIEETVHLLFSASICTPFVLVL